MNKWQEIWNKQERVNNAVLDCLLKADGFDCGAGKFNAKDWMQYVTKIDINPSDSIFEVGCGSGAFLFALKLKGYGSELNGLDYSDSLIDLASMFFNNKSFKCDEAINVDIKHTFDVVMSHSVFLYFENLDYAKEVLIKMIKKSTKKIVILDIPDKSKEKYYYAVRMKNTDSKKYEGLNHMLYDKNWFSDIALQFNLKCNIFDQNFLKYGNSKIRFNVVMTK